MEKLEQFRPHIKFDVTGPLGMA